LILRARIVAPVAQPPIENGAVALEQGKIISAGKWEDYSSLPGALDLGDVILLPGLVNAHCHLDYSHLGGQIPPATLFPDWVKQLIVIKNATSLEGFRDSWLAGARMLAETGTTTVADIESFPELLSAVLPRMPLRLYSFLEILGPRLQPGAVAGKIQEYLAKVPFPEGVSDTSGPFPGGGVNPGWWFGLSPHAPYSTTPELLAACQQMAAAKGWRITSHVAESEAEFEMFMYAQGAMHEWLRSQRDMSDCGRGSPLRCFTSAGLVNSAFLAIHLNYLWFDDADLLAQAGASVVHCPRSHRYFQHGRFPHHALRRAGVNICLGTDSLSSMETPPNGPLELNLFSEMQTLAAWDNTLAPEYIVSLATVNGARALGLSGVVGEISPGACADLIAIPYAGDASRAFEAIVQHRGPVLASMVAGRWVVPPVYLPSAPNLPWLATG
jgi:cytosine/adenosine deaminase-related metal-dependent hydrolase